MESKTPRTDAALKLEAFMDGFGSVEVVQVEFAEQLETELVQAQQEIQRLTTEKYDLVKEGLLQRHSMGEQETEIELLNEKLQKEITENLQHLGTIRWYEEMEIPKKNEQIKQAKETLQLLQEGEVRDFNYTCQHRGNCLCWPCQKQRIKAVLFLIEGTSKNANP